MFNLSLNSFIKSRKSKIASISVVLLLLSAGAQGAIKLNTKEGGYVICVDPQSKTLSHPGTKKCPKGSKRLVLGAKGAQGIAGLDGAAGLNGKDASTLWNGAINPEATVGAPGDFYINTATNNLFGPKSVDGTWPTGVSLVGASGASGPVGATGATGPAGVGASLSRVFTDRYIGLDPGQSPQFLTQFGFYVDTFTALVDLPAGNWLLDLSGLVVSGDGSADVVRCFNTPEITSTALVAIATLPDSGDPLLASFGTLAGHSVISLNERAMVEVTCGTDNRSPEVYIAVLTFTATEVGQIDRTDVYSLL